MGQSKGNYLALAALDRYEVTKHSRIDERSQTNLEISVQI